MHIEVLGLRCYNNMLCCHAEKELRHQRMENERRKLFYDLMGAVWNRDITEICRILYQDRTIAQYNGFTFHLPPNSPSSTILVQKTTSILDYTRVLNNQAIIQILIGFGAKSMLETK